MLRNIMSMGAKAILGLAIVSFATPTEALAQKHGGGHGGGGHHGGSSTWHGGSGWHHGGSNWGHGYYNGGYYGYYPGYYYGGWGAYWPYYLGYALPYRGYSSSYGYYPDYSYYPDYGYDEGYVAAPVESARIKRAGSSRCHGSGQRRPDETDRTGPPVCHATPGAWIPVLV